ncbi:synemin isoform X2 [Antennarius striatus]|uniref:synemin isoform X2 n=1 Tax=Antennarius striatus TaxID=241820 RepID=UPI0035B2AEF3
MLPFKRTFESEKQQLQELNSRLFQYLSRTKQLEQENTHLITEINKLRQTKELEPRLKDEMRDLRRMVSQLSLEKSRAEMEREKVWRELQTVRSLCSEQSEVCRDISGELKGCEKELHQAHQTNSELQQRLFQLENECQCLEDAHRQEVDHLRRQVEYRMVPIVTQTYRGPPAASVEEVQRYAHGVSEGWIETLEIYQSKVDEMDQSIKEDQAMLGDLQREKLLYVSEMDKLYTEAEKQGRIQMQLEEEVTQMQEKFRSDCGEYQTIIEQLEHEREMMADIIAEKMREHQHLLQIKMDLSMEVAAYRSLLEGERGEALQDGRRRMSQHQRERVIDIRMPAHPYTPRASTSTTRQQTDIRAKYQSPASRRDMVSFAKAQAASSAPTITSSTTTKNKQTDQREDQTTPNVPKTTGSNKTVEIKPVSEIEDIVSPIEFPTTETKSVRVVSPPMMSLSQKTETESDKPIPDLKERTDHGDKVKDKEKSQSTVASSEKKILDSVSVEEIIEKVIKPAGLEAKVCSSGESKVRYHVEKTEQEDGTTKTQIVLESKVEEDLDICEDSTLDELLNQGVKKVSLEDFKDTETGSMIKNLLSGLQGSEDLENRSVNVEIIEEPVESYSDEELEVKHKPSFDESTTTYFQIEELENVPHDTQFLSSDNVMKTFTTEPDHSKTGQVREVSRESESSYFSHDREPNEYFVSSPDDNLSEPEECGGITSYGHYGILDDLSDERYYQDDCPPTRRVTVEESDEYKYISGDHSFLKESFPECIIEEEVRVSPVVQESVLGFLREDSLEPREQLKGALEQLQSSVSGPLREELAFFAKVSKESPQNIRKVQQSSDSGATTIVAELNVSQTLEDSGLLEAEDDISEEQILKALRSSNLGLESAFQGGAGGGYSIRVSKEEDVIYGDKSEDFPDKEGSSSEISEKYIKLGAAEKSFTFKMDKPDSYAKTAPEPEMQSQILETKVKISQEKRIATVFLESPTDD